MAGFKGGERVPFDCPYCGRAHGALDQGWVPEDLPRRIHADCCNGGWYTIEASDGNSVARRRTATKE